MTYPGFSTYSLYFVVQLSTICMTYPLFCSMSMYHRYDICRVFYIYGPLYFIAWLYAVHMTYQGFSTFILFFVAWLSTILVMYQVVSTSILIKDYFFFKWQDILNPYVQWWRIDMRFYWKILCITEAFLYNIFISLLTGSHLSRVITCTMCCTVHIYFTLI